MGDIKGEKTVYFKRELDRWLNRVPDEPEITNIEHGQAARVLCTKHHRRREGGGKNAGGDPTKGCLAHQTIERWGGEQNEFIIIIIIGYPVPIKLKKPIFEKNYYFSKL